MGWPATAARAQPETPKGVKVHYEGGGRVVESHSACVGHWTDVRNMHLADKQEGYSDIAYTLGVCQHGYVLEGRNYGHQTGANGNQTLNRQHYAVCVLIGVGDTPTAEAIAALKEAIQYLRDHGAGKEIKGHRDGYATDCPGQPLYNLVTSGALEPGTDNGDDVNVPDEMVGLWNGMIWGLKHTTEGTEAKVDRMIQLLEEISRKLGS